MKELRTLKTEIERVFKKTPKTNRSGRMQQIMVRNQSTLLSATDFAANLAAVNPQLQTDFAIPWGVDAMCVAAPEGTTQDTPGQYNCVFLDSADIEGDLGYHLLADGYPEARIFMKDCIADGDQTGSVCFSHEILEMLADPSASLTSDSGHGLYSYEVCDAVEGDTYAVANGVKVSNFLYPAYFESNWPAGTQQVDFLKLLTGPFQIRPTGYSEIYVNGAWQTTWGPQADRGRIRHRKRG